MKPQPTTPKIPRAERIALIQAYLELLRTHDLYYNMSDDHSVWQRGALHMDKITRLGEKLDKELNSPGLSRSLFRAVLLS